MNYVYCVIIGLIFGSFMSMASYRFCVGKQIGLDRSRCPHCEEVILWKDLIPIISFILLRGKCRKCHHKISLLYPLNELVCAVLLVALYHHFKVWDMTILYASYFYLLLLMSEVDAYRKEIPVITIVLLYAVCIIACFVVGCYFTKRLIGMFALSIPMVLLYFVSKGSLGAGDIYVLGAIGFMFGLINGLNIAMYSYLFAGGYALYLLIRKQAKQKREIPMLPFFLLGSLCFLLF